MLSFAWPAQADMCLRGINLSGAEFGAIPGRPAFDYAYPSAANVTYFHKLGMSAVRLPFRWERLQPQLMAPLDEAELNRLDESVSTIEAAGMVAILDLHNFGHYNEMKIGARDLPVEAFSDVWRRIADHYRNQPHLVFSLMNEPFDIASTDWATIQTVAITAIRSTGARNFILATGTAYSGAHSWTHDLPVGNNGKDMLGVKDSLNRFAFDLHQYLDSDYSGRSADCPAAEQAIQSIDAVSAWLRTNKRRGFLGEFAASERPECTAALTKMIARIDAEPAIWIGWTMWGAGERWPQNYIFNLEPDSAGKRPQIKAWQAASQKAPATLMACDLSAKH
jgi:endoglucanase